MRATMIYGPGDIRLEEVGNEVTSGQPGDFVGYVGVPAGGPELPIRQLFGDNINIAGGVAPVRTYLPDLLDDVLSINPGRVFDLELPLDEVAEAYAALDERRAIKVLLRP